jgi:hypothetical protein
VTSTGSGCGILGTPRILSSASGEVEAELVQEAAAALLIAGGRLVDGLHVALAIAAGLSLAVAAVAARTPARQT